jgi:hypothetical protein
LSFYLGKFNLNQFVVLWEASKVGENAASFHFTIMMYKPSRAKRHENHTSTEEYSGHQLEAKWEEPGTIFLAFTSASDKILWSYQLSYAKGQEVQTVP